MTSVAPNDRLQCGHLLARAVKRSSTHALQKRCPHVLRDVSLNRDLHTPQRASVYISLINMSVKENSH